jgi:hypothetical protein
MRILIILVLCTIMLLAAGVVAAEPKADNPNAYIVANVTCTDGFDGDVLAPSEPAKPGFFNNGIDGLGIPRGAKIYIDDVLEYEYMQPGNGYETVTCEYEVGETEDGFVRLELQVQRVYTGKSK